MNTIGYVAVLCALAISMCSLLIVLCVFVWYFMRKMRRHYDLPKSFLTSANDENSEQLTQSFDLRNVMLIRYIRYPSENNLAEEPRDDYHRIKPDFPPNYETLRKEASNFSLPTYEEAVEIV